MTSHNSSRLSMWQLSLLDICCLIAIQGTLCAGISQLIGTLYTEVPVMHQVTARGYFGKEAVEIHAVDHTPLLVSCICAGSLFNLIAFAAGRLAPGNWSAPSARALMSLALVVFFGLFLCFRIGFTYGEGGDLDGYRLIADLHVRLRAFIMAVVTAVFLGVCEYVNWRFTKRSSEQRK